MPYTGAYDKMRSTPSSMDDSYSHVLEYKYIDLSMSVILTLNDILGLSIFVFGGNKERKMVH